MARDHDLHVLSIYKHAAHFSRSMSTTYSTAMNAIEPRHNAMSQGRFCSSLLVMHTTPFARTPAALPR